MVFGLIVCLLLCLNSSSILLLSPIVTQMYVYISQYITIFNKYKLLLLLIYSLVYKMNKVIFLFLLFIIYYLLVFFFIFCYFALKEGSFLEETITSPTAVHVIGIQQIHYYLLTTSTKKGYIFDFLYILLPVISANIITKFKGISFSCAHQGNWLKH